LELGLERFVALNRSEPFVGQKALQDIAWRGPARRLVGVRAKDSLRDPMTRRWPVGRHGRSIGMATTLVRSFRLDATIGFALIDAASARIGDDVEIHTMSGTLQACVVDLPFIESRH
jgi:glycine cleavage system aminomethyltransferase T